MAVNYAGKYSSTIDERFARESLTNAVLNSTFDFVGVKSVTVYSVPTAPMNDYVRSGDQRYGTPTELENNIQELTMSKDRSFTFTIDRGNFNDTQMANSAGLALQRQIREVVVPEIDKYRLEVMKENAATKVTNEIDSAYDAFLDATTSFIDNNVLLENCVAFISSHFYKLIKEDASFVRNGDLSQKMLMKGQVGEVDGVALIVVPAAYMPENVEFMLVSKEAVTAPVKLTEYKIHDNPPGINGWLVEGRVYYDAFVLNSKNQGIYVHSVA